MHVYGIYIIPPRPSHTPFQICGPRFFNKFKIIFSCLTEK